MARSGKLIGDSERSILNLINTDLNLALTFVRIASDSGSNQEKRDRNINHAKKAYEATLEWLGRVDTESVDVTVIATKLDRLRTQLQALGVKL